MGSTGSIGALGGNREYWVPCVALGLPHSGHPPPAPALHSADPDRAPGTAGAPREPWVVSRGGGGVCLRRTRVGAHGWGHQGRGGLPTLPSAPRVSRDVLVGVARDAPPRVGTGQHRVGDGGLRRGRGVGGPPGGPGHGGTWKRSGFGTRAGDGDTRGRRVRVPPPSPYSPPPHSVTTTWVYSTSPSSGTSGGAVGSSGRLCGSGGAVGSLRG